MRRTNSPLFLGVVGGIAESLGIGTTLLRVIFFILLCSTGFFPTMLIYFILAIVMEPAYR